VKNIIIVSKCTSIEGLVHHFHFKGVFAGDLLKGVQRSGGGK